MGTDGKRSSGGAAALALFGRYKYVLLLALAGAVCLLWPSGEQAAPPTAQSEAAEETWEEMEQEMEAILGKIQGVGEVKVMLTLDRGKEALLAEESSLSYSGDTRAPEDYRRTSEPVVLSDGEDSVVIRQEVYPKFRGALVVCSGGGDAAVRLSVIEAVSVLTGLGADKISVVKWQE